MPLPLRIALLLLLLTSPAHAQKVIRGSVKNAQTGDPLFPATVQVEGAFQATITNPGGEYELKLDALPATLIVSHIGYATARIRIHKNSPDQQDIRLQPVTYELETLVVTARNLGPDIMRKVIKRKQEWRAQLNTFSVEAYTRFTHKNDGGIVAVIESLSEAFWDREKGWREVVKSKRQTANLRFKDYLPAAVFVANLYDDNIEIAGHTLLGVTHPEALDTYDFKLQGYRFLDDRTVYDISVTPKNDRASAFVGRVSVLDGEYALIEADLAPNPRAFLFPPPIRTYRMACKQQFRNFGRAFWLPVGFQLTAELDIGMVGLRFPTLKTDQISRLTNYRINVPLPDSLYRTSDLLSVDSVAVQNDSLLARDGVVVPLTPTEEVAYETIDSTLTLYKAFKPSGFLVRWIKDPAKNRKKSPSNLDLKARPQAWYNRVDAAHLGLRLKLHSQKKRLTLGATGAYNTGIKRWSYGGDLSLGWGKKGRGLLKLTYLKGSDTRYKSDLYTRFDTSFQPLFGGDGLLRPLLERTAQRPPGLPHPRHKTQRRRRPELRAPYLPHQNHRLRPLRHRPHPASKPGHRPRRPSVRIVHHRLRA